MKVSLNNKQYNDIIKRIKDYNKDTESDLITPSKGKVEQMLAKLYDQKASFEEYASYIVDELEEVDE